MFKDIRSQLELLEKRIAFGEKVLLDRINNLERLVLETSAKALSLEMTKDYLWRKVEPASSPREQDSILRPEVSPSGGTFPDLDYLDKVFELNRSIDNDF